MTATMTNKEDLIREVRITLDENINPSPLIELGDTDTLDVDTLIRSKLNDAILQAYKEAPYYMLGSGKSFIGSIAWDSQRVGIGSGRIILPSDFLRLVCFQMSDWTRTATTPIDDEHPEYALQKSRYIGVRGCPERPVVAIIKEPIGLVLEFFSCSMGAGVHIKKANYIPIPNPNDKSIELNPRLRTAIVYYTAYLVALTLSRNEQAIAFKNMYTETLK